MSDSKRYLPRQQLVHELRFLHSDCQRHQRELCDDAWTAEQRRIAAAKRGDLETSAYYRGVIDGFKRGNAVLQQHVTMIADLPNIIDKTPQLNLVRDNSPRAQPPSTEGTGS